MFRGENVAWKTLTPDAIVSCHGKRKLKAGKDDTGSNHSSGPLECASASALIFTFLRFVFFDIFD